MPTQLRAGSPPTLGGSTIQLGTMVQGTLTNPPIRILPRGEALLVASSEGFPQIYLDSNGGVARYTVINENLQARHQVQDPPVIQVYLPFVVLDVHNAAIPLPRGQKQPQQVNAQPQRLAP